MKKIYIYKTKASEDLGLLKIGEAINVEERIKNQFNTAAMLSHTPYEILYEVPAIKADGTSFGDKDIHRLLRSKGYRQHSVKFNDVTIKNKTEWFEIDIDDAIFLIEEFITGKPIEKIPACKLVNFPPRPEQESAVNKTLDYFKKHGGNGRVVDFLWNAKMRFGKTFATYLLNKRMGVSKTLIATYKPVVEKSWRDDLTHHAEFQDYVFLSGKDVEKLGDYENDKVVVFLSFQDLLGRGKKNDFKEHHKSIFETHWDLIVIDEFHYGAESANAIELLDGKDDEFIDDVKQDQVIDDVVKKELTSTYRLYLSGTPFKALANDRFDEDAIYNWTYVDEQKAKERWLLEHPNEPKENNPYYTLPKIRLFVYKLSQELIEKGIASDQDEFSLNYFFATNNGKFINEDAVNKWLDIISGLKSEDDKVATIAEQIDEINGTVIERHNVYPFDPKSLLSDKIDHSLWYLHRVDSAIALKRLMDVHPVFSKYHVVLSAGNNTGAGLQALEPVLDAIKTHDKTITLSVGKLTTGVSIPQWKAVVFLRDTASPENYFQTAFRAQTPYVDVRTKQVKEECYILDFSPNRALMLINTYSEKLTNNSELTSPRARIDEFIRYLPVLKVEGNTLLELDTTDVITNNLQNIGARNLGCLFISNKNITVSRHVLDLISQDPDVHKKCLDILSRIKKFRRFNGGDKETKAIEDTLVDLDVNNKKIKKLESKRTGVNEQKEKEKIDKEISDSEKKIKKESERIRELLKTLLSRVPLFMYLTDATEETLDQVLLSDRDDLFRKATGITPEDFNYLRKLGVIKTDSIDGYVTSFLILENQNYEELNRLLTSIG
jgi:hypothetical protein